MEKGVIYLVRGTSSALWWHIYRKHPDTLPEIMLKPSASSLRDSLSYCSPFDEVKLVVIYPSSEALPLDLDIDPNVIAYYWLSELDGSLNKSAEKLYKSAGGNYHSLDLRKQDYLYDELYSSTLSRLDINTRNALVSSFSNPWRCLWQAQQLEPELYELEEDELSETTRLLTDLGTAQSLISWRNITLKTMYSVFLTPEQENCGLYLILVGKGRSYGRCPALWAYYSQAYQALNKKYYHEPGKFLTLFATWVYMTNTVFATGRHKGLREIPTRKGTQMLVFNPSPSAVQEFFRLIRSPVLADN